MMNTFHGLILSLVLISFTACGGGGSSESPKDDLPINKSQKESSSAHLAAKATDFSRLGLASNKVEAWEDTMRTDGGEGSYEWWYCDFSFEDGSTVVVAFYTKLVFNTQGKASPMAAISIVDKNGTQIQDQYFDTTKNPINLSSESADIHIDKSYLTYKDNNYQLHYEHNNIVFDANMTSNEAMWRAKTGYIYFGEEDNDYFAWLVAQPSSTVNARLKVDQNISNLQGSGYHDHNWGNSPMHKNMDNWYWGRAKIGEYSLIFSDIIAHEDYGFTKIPLLMIAKDNRVINLKGEVIVKRENLQTDKQTNKSYAQKLIFKQSDEHNKSYTIEIEKKEDIAFIDMQFLPYPSGDRPTYLRTRSDIKLTIQDANHTSQTYNGKGIIEQMSFWDKIKNN